MSESNPVVDNELWLAASQTCSLIERFFPNGLRPHPGGGGTSEDDAVGCFLRHSPLALQSPPLPECHLSTFEQATEGEQSCPSGAFFELSFCPSRTKQAVSLKKESPSLGSMAQTLNYF